MEPGAVYLYCFTRPGALAEGAPPGVDGRAEVTALGLQRVEAVYSPVSAGEFQGAEAETSLQDPAWVVARACRHEEILETVMKSAPVLPVRFGAVFSSRLALKRLLADHYTTIAAFLDEIADREEWSVKAYLDSARAEAWLIANDSVLAEQHRSLSAAPGTRYFQEKRLRAVVQQQVKPWLRTVVTEAQHHLEKVALAGHPLRLQGRDEAGDNVLNLAFLLLRDCVAEFCRRVEELARCHAAQGLTLTTSGPWPPFNFCPVLGDAHP